VRERVVREADVDGGRMDGFGRALEPGMEMRRCAARAKGNNRKALEICMVVVLQVVGSVLEGCAGLG